ncbi:MAG: AmmeMemoRadiSam system radical SAM enzyme [Thermoplasmata archaeon]
MKEAMYWEVEEDKIRCKLCPQNCLIGEGERGICNVRKNIEGKLYSLIYGKVASLAVDPIEKKPLYHFYPGTSVLSHGSMGCNLKCKFCQNASLSNGDPESPYLKEYTVAELADQALNHDGIAWTYNEPTITYEYNLDVSKKIKEMDGGYVVYVTNGFINNDPLEELSPYLDAMNIDIKAFHDDFYRKIVGGRLQPVLDTAVKAVESGIHVEVTYLIIPGYNDEYEEIEDFSEWVMHNLGEDTVVHFSRFHPDHDMRDVPATPEKTMKKAREIAKKVGLNFVYLGNLPADNDTKCPECGATIISRSFFSSGRLNLQDGKCPECGRKIPIIH